MSYVATPMLNRLLGCIRDLREELTAYEDITEAGGANEAMRLIREITVELGECPYEAPSHKCVILNGLIGEALDFLNHELEVKHGYRQRGQ